MQQSSPFGFLSISFVQHKSHSMHEWFSLFVFEPVLNIVWLIFSCILCGFVHGWVQTWVCLFESNCCVWMDTQWVICYYYLHLQWFFAVVHDPMSILRFRAVRENHRAMCRSASLSVNETRVSFVKMMNGLNVIDLTLLNLSPWSVAGTAFNWIQTQIGEGFRRQQMEKWDILHSSECMHHFRGYWRPFSVLLNMLLPSCDVFWEMIMQGQTWFYPSGNEGVEEWV